MNLIPMIGKTFVRLTVLERAGTNTDRKAMYLCSCSCGNNIVTTGKALRSGKTKSCGCYGYEVRRKAVTKHGYASTPIYHTWRGILDRCHNPNSVAYEKYGAVGIFVCERWRKDFGAFLSDMGERPDGMTIERKNNALGYSPDNCLWATRKEQANNKSNNRRLTLHGTTLTMSQWSERLGINYSIIQSRLERGWDDEKTLTFKSQVFQSLTIDDITKSIADWCRYYRINYLTVRHRLKRGWSPILALTTPAR